MNPPSSNLAEKYAHGMAGLVIRAAREDEVSIAVEMDDDACLRYAELGPSFDIDLPDDHPFVVDEIRRWTLAARDGRLFFACSESGEPVGFAALMWVGGRPHLDQLSVRRAWMGRGVGTELVALAHRWSAAQGELWLTTYSSVPWNRRWYEKLGFTAAAERDWNSELHASVQREREVLPRGDDRIVMVYRHAPIR